MQLVWSLDGFSDLVTKLATFEDKVAKRLARAAVKAGLKPVLETAQELCPVSVDGSHGNPPGYLRDSLVIRMLPERKANAIAAEITTRKGAFESGDYYGGEVEFGTHRMAAEPYLRPAMDTRKEAAIEATRDKLLSGIEGQRAFEAGLDVGENE